MADLPNSFTITIGDIPIAFNTDPESETTRAEANANNPAVFSFNAKQGLLQSGAYYLSRILTEDRTMLPKAVFWCKREECPEEMSHKTTIEKQNGEYLLRSGSMYSILVNLNFVDVWEGPTLTRVYTDAPLTIINGHVYGDLTKG